MAKVNTKMKRIDMKCLNILASIAIALCSMFHYAKADTMNAYQEKMLNSRQEKIVTIAAFTANGNLEKLKTALNEGLDAGLTVSEIREILIQMYAYTGFPRSLNGINTFMNVISERQKKGIEDIAGEEPAVLPAGTNRDEYGEKVRMKLAGISTLPPKSGYQIFAPGIDTFLKEHLFADIFGRGVLDYSSREIATVSALAAMTGTEGQLQFHMSAAMNVGVTGTQMENLLSVLNEKVGTREAVMARKVYARVQENRAKNR